MLGAGPATARIPGSGVTGSAAWAFAFLARVAGKGLVLSHDAVSPIRRKSLPADAVEGSLSPARGTLSWGPLWGRPVLTLHSPARDSRPLTRPDVAQVTSGELTDTGGLFPAPAVLSPQQGPGGVGREGDGHHVWSEGPRGKGHVTS